VAFIHYRDFNNSCGENQSVSPHADAEEHDPTRQRATPGLNILLIHRSSSVSHILSPIRPLAEHSINRRSRSQPTCDESAGYGMLTGLLAISCELLAFLEG
jgi:hypothetical protein